MSTENALADEPTATEAAAAVVGSKCIAPPPIDANISNNRGSAITIMGVTRVVLRVGVVHEKSLAVLVGLQP